MMKPQRAQHKTGRVNWLRAAVLGANDGIVSTSSLVVGVAVASAGSGEILLAGIAGLVAGAMSMAAGEYVSVSSQADTEEADLHRERKELAADHEYELAELANIYIKRGLEPVLAKQVAEQLMKHDALAAHARDEIGISETVNTNPIQAALASGASFALGAALPLIILLFAPEALLVPIVFIASLCFLALLGYISARIGGSPRLRAVLRVSFWGALAMVITAAVGSLFGIGT
jgi:vacuolar iron transporter family protein